MVKRYDEKYDDEHIIESEDGDYVLFKDYEHLQQRLSAAEADLELCKKWLRDCHESKAKIGDRCLALESERDELQHHCESYKAAYDAILADLKIMEQKLNDLQVENARLIRLGEERHIRAKDTEEGLMEHVERLQVKNKSLLDAIKIIHGLSMNDRILKDVEIRNVCRQALEVRDVP